MVGAQAGGVAAAPVVDRSAFGVVLAGQTVPGFDARARLDRVAATWYYDYTPRLDDEVDGYHKVAMARGGEQNRSDLAAVARQAKLRPGHAWLIFNEPDLVGQDAVSDAFLLARGETRFGYYARLLHDYAVAIKGADPTAVLVGPNLFNDKGQGIAWMRSLRATYLAAYGQDLPLDVLGVHLYAFDPTWTTLPQLDLHQNELFLADATQFAAELPRRPPVWVTEVGSLWVYSDLRCEPSQSGSKCRGSVVDWTRLSVYASQIVRMMGAAGVERWFFFSTNPTLDPWAAVPNATYLADEQNRLTPLGQAWLNAQPGPKQEGWAEAVTRPPLALGHLELPG